VCDIRQGKLHCTSKFGLAGAICDLAHAYGRRVEMKSHTWKDQVRHVVARGVGGATTEVEAAQIGQS
jgi:hypothetical protein